MSRRLPEAKRSDYRKSSTSTLRFGRSDLDHSPNSRSPLAMESRAAKAFDDRDLAAAVGLPQSERAL
jgi:hypothetical protein